MKHYKQIQNLVFVILVSMSTSALAAGGGPLLHMEVDLSNQTSLQRGAKTFVNYCVGCHSAAYMRYNRIGKDLGISDDVLKTNFMFGTDKVGDTMTIAMRSEDAEQYFGGAVPPDLSVTARARGADWLYSYFKTFYVDESRPVGVNNLQFPDVGMPNIFWQLQGTQRLTPNDHGEGHHGPSIEDLEIIKQGSQSEEEFDQTVRDLVNFMVYLSEPIQLKRTKIGTWVLLYLFVFAVITYMLKKEYWRDVH